MDPVKEGYLKWGKQGGGKVEDENEGNKEGEEGEVEGRAGAG